MRWPSSALQVWQLRVRLDFDSVCLEVLGLDSNISAKIRKKRALCGGPYQPCRFRLQVKELTARLHFDFVCLKLLGLGSKIHAKIRKKRPLCGDPSQPCRFRN